MSSPESKYLSKQFRDGVYIPAGLILVGTLIAKRDWLPYAVALTAVLAGYKVWTMRRYTPVLAGLLPESPRLTTNTTFRRAKGPQAHGVARL